MKVRHYPYPDWFPAALSEAWKKDRDARIAAMPRIKFRYGRAPDWGPWSYAFGVMWDKDPAPREGSDIYRRELVLYVTFHHRLVRRL